LIASSNRHSLLLSQALHSTLTCCLPLACRDVLNVLGMYPGDPGPPGADCAGVVLSVGAGVTHLQTGDRVFGLAGGSLGSHVDCSSMTVVKMPSALGFEAAATTPTVFITVDSAFRQAAACRPGERVLVHAAAGGVGLAAIQMVDTLGGVVVATAGSPSKRTLVRGCGVAEVLGSRDTQFVSEAAELGGVDIVLNSLTSSGMVAGSLAALRRGGRFVEISKRDIWSPARMAQGGWERGFLFTVSEPSETPCICQSLELRGIFACMQSAQT
jgi:NADPH:quinone reductase-like Zn-dependent oxidoreductase